MERSSGIEETEKQFLKLKEIICSDLVLSLPDFEREMIITTDASEIGYGVVLELEVLKLTKTAQRHPDPLNTIPKITLLHRRNI